MIALLVSLLIIGVVAYLAERGMPQYFRAIRLIALLLVLLVLLRFAGLW